MIIIIKHIHEKKKKVVRKIQQKTAKGRKQKTDKERDRGEKRKQRIDKERQRRKTEREELEDRKRNRQIRIGYEKTKIKNIYVSFKEQITLKAGRKNTVELKFARYTCAGEMSTRVPMKDRKDRHVLLDSVEKTYDLGTISLYVSILLFVIPICTKMQILNNK